ncbi:hypothetical protein BV22DRAFT_1135520 [Leucogyrophana mollusca]|uniref:Uncharacterized protein n=1 Tax=Leucogyrophana mollusca TaxID=85980 RepID=A0ACB8AV96_9AGAM|nr:hypothetical protein BV22DRAFT_1135520 [Leucogyrophana mollusca]
MPTGITVRMLLEKADGPGSMTVSKQMDVDDGYGRAGDDDASQVTAATEMSPVLSGAGLAMEFPVPLKLAMQLAFSMLSFVLCHPTRRAPPFAHSSLSPYIGMVPP